MPWIAPLVGVGANLLLGGGSSSGGGAAGGGAGYVGADLSGADTGWQQAFNAQSGIASGNQQATSPYFGNSLQQGENINYQPYLQAANQSGQAYGQAGNLAQQQAGQYGQMAQTAQGQQQQLYGAGNQIYQTAFDPQNALYAQQQQQLTDQVNSGQAMRGLGNSAEGASEYNQAMGNFDINWQNNQLSRQAQGITSLDAANQAGMNQGTQYGNMQQAALNSQNAAGVAYGMSGQVPMTAQQYAASQPGAIANTYQGYMQGQQGLYGTVANQGLGYMNQGTSAQQGNAVQTSANNAAMVQGLGNAAKGYFGQPTQPSYIAGGAGAGLGYGGQTTVDDLGQIVSV